MASSLEMGTRKFNVEDFKLAPPRPLVETSLEDRRRSRDQLLVMLSRCKNPATGQLYTTAELANVFSINTRAIRRRLNDNGIFKLPMPEVRKDPLPENEHAFFSGLAMGNFTTEVVRLGKRPFVVIATESPNPKKRDLLQATVGAWGTTRNNPTALRVYVNSPDFDFMTCPQIDAKFLRARSRFAPFLLGTLAVKLSDRQDRLSMRNPDLLRRIDAQFEDMFGFEMGRFEVEKKVDGQKYRRDSLAVIHIKNPGKVVGVLVQEPSVHKLPFCRDVVSR